MYLFGHEYFDDRTFDNKTFDEVHVDDDLFRYQVQETSLKI